ncbi:hypothetical protein FRC12_022639 [Ceratobasidium sp. 428]|nr:hypothetical protein FRC12_022639 [Ceratobasidium sp. 428]
MSGDDLDDGLVLEPAFHNDSDAASVHELDDEYTIAVEPTPVAGKKRKRTQKPPAEPKAKKPKPPPQNAPTRHISMCQSPAALAQLLERALIKAFPKLSDLEREELVLPEPALVDTTQFTTERTHATLPDFISATCPNLAARIAQRPKHHGAPTALVVAGAALRVADLTRTLRPLKGESGGEIAKVCSIPTITTRTIARASNWLYTCLVSHEIRLVAAEKIDQLASIYFDVPIHRCSSRLNNDLDPQSPDLPFTQFSGN